MDEILVLAEHRQGELREISFEMLCLANRIGKEKSIGVTAAVLGDPALPFAEELKGACDRVLFLDAPEVANYNAEPYLNVMGQIIRERNPGLIILAHTASGMDLAPALALKAGIPLATDCLEVNMKEDGFSALRQVYAGKINSELIFKPSERYMITLRPGCFKAEREQGKSAELVNLQPPVWGELNARRFLDFVESELGDVDITAADILVSIGRGVGKVENIPLVQEFADAIGATLSCSRPVADQEWLPKSRQVGTSGKTVKPKVYIALGISGAFQHQAGMKNADTIIAVNTDPKAPIFQTAHYGIVADMMQVVPVLKEIFTRT